MTLVKMKTVVFLILGLAGGLFFFILMLAVRGVPVGRRCWGSVLGVVLLAVLLSGWILRNANVESFSRNVSYSRFSGSLCPIEKPSALVPAENETLPRE